MNWNPLHGNLMRGYRVASGPSKDYPYGTLEKQMPFFKQRGLDLSGYFNGTLNINISPLKYEMLKPQYTFPQVEWTDLHPPETFSFSRCKIIHSNAEYDGWVYYPHPETKLRHFQNPSLLEVIAMPIPQIQYDDQLEVWINADEIKVSAAG